LLFLFLLFSILFFNFSLRRRTELCRFLDILPPVASVFWVWSVSVCVFVVFFGLIFCFCGWVLLFVFDVLCCCYSFFGDGGSLSYCSAYQHQSPWTQASCARRQQARLRDQFSLSLSLSPREGENCICLASALVLSFSQNLKNDSESCLCDPGNCSSTPCFFFFFFYRTKPRSLSLSL
jgi:hypothetical protein